MNTEKDFELKITLVGKVIEVTVHFLIWDWGGKGTRNLYFASFAGLPESVKAVSASLLESYEAQMNRIAYSRCNGEPYKRLMKPIGLGDVAHGCIYNQFFELSSIEQVNDPEKHNRALLIAPEGNMEKVVAEHVICRFGFPREWESAYYNMFQDYCQPLFVEVNPNFMKWNKVQALLFKADEKQAIERLTEALKTKKLLIPESDVVGEFNPEWSMSEYMLNNATHLAEKLADLKPRHSFDQPIDPAIADMLRIPFPTQAHVIQAIVNTVDCADSESPILGGDMGSGKSIMAGGAAHVMHQRKKRRTGKSGMAVLLSAPAITLPKWKSKELLKTVPDIEVNIIRSGNDALALLKRVRQGYKPKKLEFTLVGIDKAKLGSEIYFGGIWKRMYNVPLEDELGTFEYAWHCPGCGKPILVPLDEGDDKSELVPAPWDTFADVPMVSAQELEIARRQGELLPNGLPKGIKIKWKRHSKLPKFCEHSFPLTGVDATREGKEENPDRICGERLWRPAIHSLGESRNRSRVNISQVLKRLKGYFALYICDEAHMCKSEDSGRGDAFAQMVKSAKRTLMLTGTITNGKSTSIKELLWRTDPRSLLEAGVDYQTGSVEWASRFGKLEQVIKEEGGDEGVITRRNKRSVQTKEAPGIAPQLTAQFLLHKSAFLELPDLGLPLVELKEYPVFLDMDEGHGEHYTKFHNTLHEACKKASGASGTPGARSKFNPATLMYSARPDQEMIVRLGQSAYTAPALGDGSMLHAKERWLVETVQSELSEGRRCIIFNQFTGSYNMNERVEEILQRMGVRCKILNEPNTELRTQRLAEYEAEEYPVIICAMKLVEVGLDMMYWPTIIYNQLSYEVSTVRQSSRRAWRIGQDRECRVYYPIYNRSQQMKQFMHIMSARGHALMVEGRLDKSELASFSIDSQSSLARDLASCFAGADVAKAWTTLAAKEMAGIEMIAEANFKDVLSERMQRLADETLKLCGIDPAQWHQERSKKPIIKEIGETRTIDLMNDLLIRQEVQAETSATTRILSNNVINLEEEIRILTFAELIMDEPRKILKKQIPTHENQLMWDFG